MMTCSAKILITMGKNMADHLNLGIFVYQIKATILFKITAF